MAHLLATNFKSLKIVSNSLINNAQMKYTIKFRNLYVNSSS